MTTRLGAIGFINTLPVYFDLNEPNIEVVYGSPTQLNQAMQAGTLQISPVSSAFYLRHQNDLQLLEDLSVSSAGAAESVIFLSKTPLDTHHPLPSTIPIPDDSETSVALLRHLIQTRYNEDPAPRFQVYPAHQYTDILKTHHCGLIIGDHALQIQEEGLTQDYHSYDLASLWAETTGHPFVFAVWVANRSWAQEHPHDCRQVHHALIESRNRFFQQPALWHQGLQDAVNRCKIPEERINHYWQHALQYTLTPDHHKALLHFKQVIQTLDTLAHDSQSKNFSHKTPRAGAQVSL